MRPTSLLVTVTGRDRPGVTAVIFAALAAHDVDVRDVVQAVSGARASLAILVDLRGDTAALRHSVSSTAKAFGVDSNVITTEDDAHVVHSLRRSHARAGRSRAMVVGTQLRAGALGNVAKRVSDVGGSIESMWQASGDELTGVEMSVAGDPARLRPALISAADETGLDIAVGPGEPRTRARRLLVLDADTTFARAAPASPRVRAFVDAARRAGCSVGAVSGRADARRYAGLGLDVVSAGEGADTAVRELADEAGISIARVVAAGDGQESAPLLMAAGTAVAVDAAAARRASADASGRSRFLDSVLYVLSRI
jgi:predicted amino acid-binding ACT domain protein